MTDDPRSPKRPRLSVSPRAILIVSPGDSSGSESDAAGEEKYTRDLDFWLDDGNLILLAGRSAFRVYRGLLVKNSPVFADMFTTGSAGATETFDNCPVVRLADHPQNLRDFLQYLMPCSALVLVEEVPECRFEQLHAAFHLAHKYQCQDVEARILFVLKKFYTSNFNDHDRYATSKYTLVPPPPQAAIAAVNITRLTSTLSMLPFALYLVCTLEGRAVDGYERRDGSAEHLSAEDLKLCMNARGTLAWELAALTKTVFSSTEYPSLQCMHPDSCVVAEDTMFCETQENVPGGCDVLESYRESVDEWAKAYGMCKGCKRKLLSKVPGLDLHGIEVFDVGNPLSGLSGSFGQSPSRLDMPYRGGDNLSEQGARLFRAISRPPKAGVTGRLNLNVFREVVLAVSTWTTISRVWL